MSGAAQARREAELKRMEPHIRAMEHRLVNGMLTRDALAELGLNWRDFSRLGRVVSDRLKSAIEGGTMWRRIVRYENLHFRAMNGNDRALIKLWKRDRVRAAAHDAHV